ncbi:MAG: excinuclease ABC subunit UvrC, partial [Actinomycetes bacterium]
MVDPSSYRPASGEVPDAPGVYRFADADGRVIYVGKAKSLRSRLSSYFADPATLHSRTYAMVHAASSVQWNTVRNEVEALQVEYEWIKEFDPRFNVKYRDDKSYPYLAVTTGEEFPRALVMRGSKRPGVRYFGPYAHAWAIRETLDQLLRVFPVRSCSKGVFRRAGQMGRPCLLGYIGKCSAPCVGRVTPDEHRALVDDLVAFLGADPTAFTKRTETAMLEAAREQDYERAARLRDDLHAMQRALQRSAVVLADDTDADVIGLADDSLEAAIQVFIVRGGRVRGQRGFVVDRVEEIDTAELVEHFCLQYYSDHDDVPREVLVPELPSDVASLEQLLSERRGTRVTVRTPQRGDKRALMQTVERNAQQALVLHKTRRASDLTTRSRALEEIQQALELPEAPLRIEGFDVSHHAGEEVVASMVVFEDGLPRKSEYRRFAIRDVVGQDDV